MGPMRSEGVCGHTNVQWEQVYFDMWHCRCRTCGHAWLEVSLDPQVECRRHTGSM